MDILQIATNISFIKHTGNIFNIFTGNIFSLNVCSWKFVVLNLISNTVQRINGSDNNSGNGQPFLQRSILSIFLYVSINVSSYYPSIYLSIYQNISIYIHIYLSIYLYIYISIYLYIYLYIYLSIYLDWRSCVLRMAGRSTS